MGRSLLCLVAVLATGFAVGAGCADGNGSATDEAGDEDLKREATDREVADRDGDWLEGAQAQTADIRGPALIREVYIGVACPKSNSIRCDRVGVAIRLRDRGARSLRVWVADREVKMHPINSNEELEPRRGHLYWQGYLQPAGLLDGPLRSLAESGRFRWEGRPAVAASIRIEARSSGHWTTLGSPRGALFSASFDDVSLHAGFG